MIEFEEYKQRLSGLTTQLDELYNALDIKKAQEELSALEGEIAREDFWLEGSNSQAQLQRIKILKDKLMSYDKLKSLYEDLSTICQMAIEENDDSMREELISGYNQLVLLLQNTRLTTLLTGIYDKNNAIISFHAGAGGTEAQDWAQMLFRMYCRWAERHGFKTKTLDYLDGDEAGLKSADLLIEGENAFGFLKSEMGVHRLVRISPFDSSGRRHTSFAAIEVMPEIDDSIEIDINADDLRVDTYRSGGAGGQHVNKTESAIRITHIPTGIVVACQNERSQHQNRDVAMRMLKSRLIEVKERQHLEKIEDIKGVQMKIEWGSQIRSYVFMPYTLAKDHRTNFENGNVSAVMDGDLDGFINAYLVEKQKDSG